MSRGITAAVFLVIVCGCGPAPAPPDARGKVRLAPVGDNPKFKAGLTAYEDDREGARLELTFETADAAHAPAPLPLKRIEATARDSSGREFVLEFRRRPLPTDPDGACSRFVADVPSALSPDERYTISATVEVEGRTERLRWEDVPLRKYTRTDQ